MIKLHMLGDYRLIANSQCCIALGCCCGSYIHTHLLCTVMCMLLNSIPFDTVHKLVSWMTLTGEVIWFSFCDLFVTLPVSISSNKATSGLDISGKNTLIFTVGSIVLGLLPKDCPPEQTALKSVWHVSFTWSSLRDISHFCSYLKASHTKQLFLVWRMVNLSSFFFFLFFFLWANSL